MSSPSFARQVTALLRKDLQAELRSREVVATVSLFSVLVVLLISFAFVSEGRPPPSLVAGILWVCLAYSGTLGISRYFAREREEDAASGLLLSPASRGAIYLSKLIGTMFFMTGVSLLVVPLLIVLFRLEIASPLLFVATMILGMGGFAIVGSLFAAGLMRARGREILLAILTYPVALPVLIAGSKATIAVCGVEPNLPAALLWLKVLGAFDVVFLVLSLYVFGPLVSAD